MDRQGKNVAVILGVAVGAFILYQLLQPAAASAASIAGAATPAPPQEPGVVIRGRNASAFLPLPDLSGLPIIGGLFARPSEAGPVVSATGNSFQVLGP